MTEFDLAAVLSQAAKRNVTNADGRESIQYIDVQQIHADPQNFYSTDGIEDLAANIEMIGLQQPIRVKRMTDNYGLFYRVVSGHRRLAAWNMLDRNCPGTTYRKIAAIVEPDREEPEALQQLRLIFANSDTRKMTGHDLQMQAQRVKQLLMELKKDGYEFKGRMRDQVAQICGVSKSKLSRLDAIESNLHAGILGAFYKQGKIGETVAYEISKLPMEEQANICRKLSKGWRPTGEELVRYEQERGAAEKPKQKAAAKEKTCPEWAQPDPEPEDLPEEPEAKPAEPTARWMTGTPTQNHGLYYCKIEIEGSELRQILQYGVNPVAGGQWFMQTGYRIDDKCKIKAWWPLPEE